MARRWSHSDAIFNILLEAARARSRQLITELTALVGFEVQGGPFAGMTLSDRAGWSDADTLPMLLGVYESELHHLLEEVVESAPDVVINIGAANGYYAAGLARRLPRARVFAFDIDSTCQDVCRETSRLNQVADRVEVAGQCEPATLQAILARADRPFVICDCVGAEKELIDPMRTPALRKATLIVETHDFIDASITDLLIKRLEATHAVSVGREGGRDPSG